MSQARSRSETHYPSTHIVPSGLAGMVRRRASQLGLLASDSDFRRRFFERLRLRRQPRFRPMVTTLLGPPLQAVDAASFLSAYEAIFEDEIYRFRPTSEAPRILDCGANVGLAVVYWKRLFPQARITAFEPDPDVFRALSENCRALGYQDVELIPKALWSSEGSLPFLADGGDAGRLTPTASVGTRVATVRLRDYLQEEVDLLKLDVEGAEVELILDCAAELTRVENAFVEYHSFLGEEQRLDELLRVLRGAGFRVHIVPPDLVSRQPFLARDVSGDMDQRLNIYAFRTS